MTDHINGGPAFPTNGDDWQDGMSLRDWFAGQALAGFASTIANVIEPNWESMAIDSYKVADAMLAAKGGAASYSIRKEGQGDSTYYVTRSENGEVIDRTRVLVPDQRNLFFSRRKAETAAVVESSRNTGEHY